MPPRLPRPTDSRTASQRSSSPAKNEGTCIHPLNRNIEVKESVPSDLRGLVGRGEEGFTSNTIHFAESFARIDDVPDLHLQRQLRQELFNTTQRIRPNVISNAAKGLATGSKEFIDLNRIPGLAGDAVISTTALRTGSPLVTNDEVLYKTLKLLGHDARNPNFQDKVPCT